MTNRVMRFCRSHFRAVVWPRQTDTIPPVTGPEGKPLYRYAIVGMLVTDQPIDGLEGNEIALDGPAYPLVEALPNVTRVKLRYEAGDASSVLASLDTLFPEPGAQISTWSCPRCYQVVDHADGLSVGAEPKCDGSDAGEPHDEMSMCPHYA